MANQGTGRSQQGGSSTTGNIRVYLHNGPQAAGRIAQGQSHLNSIETKNSTHIAIDTPVDEETGDVANNTETAVVSQTLNLKKSAEMDSGYERDESIHSTTSTRGRHHNPKQLKRRHSEDRDVNLSAVKKLCPDINYEKLANRLIALLGKQKILPPENTEHPSTSGINCQSDAGPGTSDQSPKKSKVGYAQHGAGNEALPGTSSHPSIRRHAALAGVELCQRKAGGDILTEENVTSRNNNNDNGYERTANYVASLPAIDHIQKKTATTSLHSHSESNAPSEHLELLNSLDLSKEFQRRMTFVNWPHRSSVSFTDTAANNGLYFLGNGDRTRCHFCNCILENWHPDDNVAEKHENISPDCKMVLELNPGYSDDVEQSGCLPVARVTPAHPHMCLEKSRLKTFTGTWPIKSSVEVPKRLAKAGFYYSGHEDHLICWYCSARLNNWAPGLDPWEEHAKWFPNCEFLLEVKGPNFVQQHHASWKPCLFWEDIQDPTGRTKEVYHGCVPPERNSPANPGMSLEKSRLRSFVSSWPTNTLPTSTLFAKAGFFYAGEEDYCRCWYCNCALKNWGTGDDPSKEHAKWFPNCEFLLDRNGLEFVKYHHASWRPVYYQEKGSQEEHINELVRNCPGFEMAIKMGVAYDKIRQLMETRFTMGKGQYESKDDFWRDFWKLAKECEDGGR